MRYLSNKSHREYPSAGGLNFIHLCSACLIHLDSHTLKPSYETKVKGIQRLTFFLSDSLTLISLQQVSRGSGAITCFVCLFVSVLTCDKPPLARGCCNLCLMQQATLLAFPLSRSLFHTHTHTNTHRLFFHCLFFDSTHTSLYQLTLFTCFLTYSNTDQLYSETRALTSNQKLGMAI